MPDRTTASATLDEEPARSSSTVGAYADAIWATSSFCGGNGSCVEIARLASGQIGVRDGKQGPGGPVLVFSREEWAAFTAGVKAGELS